MTQTETGFVVGASVLIGIFVHSFIYIIALPVVGAVLMVAAG